MKKVQATTEEDIRRHMIKDGEDPDAENDGPQWAEKNRNALASSNDHVERNGLPLSAFRQF